jgi:RNA polymerase sigma-70 factor (ECF subfamily)
MNQNVCDKKTYHSIFLEQSEKIRNFIYYKSGNIAQAEDIVQDAFIKLWENCSKVELGKAKSFLFTVANNLFLNQVKRQKHQLKFSSQNQTSEVPSPQFLLEEEEFRLRLEAAINALPEGQRVVFLMNRIDKKKYKEIAEELKLSVKAVEKRMHQALVALRKIHKKL